VTLLDSIRGPERPPFELALAFWREQLTRRALGAPLQWLFRENLTLGHDRDPGESATLCFQRFSPRFDERDAQEVYGLAAEWEHELRFTPLAATPREIVATLCTDLGSDLASVHRRDWGLSFDLEPAFDTFSEIRSRREWRRATCEDLGACAELEGVLLGRLVPVMPRE